MVRRVVRIVQVVEGEPFAFRIPVEQDLLLASVARLPADQRMLPARAVPPVIGEWPVRLRHGGIILLDATAHLAHQLLTDSGCPLERRIRIGILAIEVLADRGGERTGVLEDLLPVRGFEPGEFVAQAMAVDRDVHLLPMSDWGRRQGVTRKTVELHANPRAATTRQTGES
jgi:hypothetical protein